MVENDHKKRIIFTASSRQPKAANLTYIFCLRIPFFMGKMGGATPTGIERGHIQSNEFTSKGDYSRFDKAVLKFNIVV